MHLRHRPVNPPLRPHFSPMQNEFLLHRRQPARFRICLFSHDLTPPVRCCRHLPTNSFAASRHSGNSNVKPSANSRLGTTRLLFRISSVSVRKKNAPTSSIHSVAGRATQVPHASRSPFMNSAFVRGFGDATFTTPLICSFAIRNSTALTKSVSCTQETYCCPEPNWPPIPKRTKRSSASNAPPRSGLIVTALLRATFRVFGVSAAKKVSSHRVATSTLNRQVSGTPFSVPPSSPVSSSIARSVALRYLVCRLLLGHTDSCFDELLNRLSHQYC